MKSVAVLHHARSLPSTYGLVPVVLKQLRMLVNHGYTPALYVVEGFKPDDLKKIPQGVEVKPVIPFMHLFDYQLGIPEQKQNVGARGEHAKPANKTNLKKQVELLETTLEAELPKYDVVITHDIIFQTWFIPYNQAIRNIAERHPDIKWIHWLHSGPSPRPDKIDYPHTLRFSSMPNSVWVSPNESMTAKFAEMYNIPKQQVKVVYHTFDCFKFCDMHPLSVDIIKQYNLLNAEIVCVWATRIDHPHAKGLFKAVWLISQLNKLTTAKLVFLNSWSRGEKAKHTIKQLRETADEWGLPQDHLIFSSEMGEEWENGVPHLVVRDLLLIGNLFVLPSQSETFSLAMGEAAFFKNLLYLNQDLAVLKELAGDNALYGGFGYEWGGVQLRRDQIENGDLNFKQNVIMNDAKIIYDELKKNKPLMMQRKVLNTFNEEWVFQNQLEYLLEGDW